MATLDTEAQAHTMCDVQFDFDPTEEQKEANAVAIHVGDEVVLTNTHDDWCEGLVNGVPGFFPSNYIQTRVVDPEVKTQPDEPSASPSVDVAPNEQDMELESNSIFGSNLNATLAELDISRSHAPTTTNAGPTPTVFSMSGIQSQTDLFDVETQLRSVRKLRLSMERDDTKSLDDNTPAPAVSPSPARPPANSAVTPSANQPSFGYSVVPPAIIETPELEEPGSEEPGVVNDAGTSLLNPLPAAFTLDYSSKNATPQFTPHRSPGASLSPSHTSPATTPRGQGTISAPLPAPLPPRNYESVSKAQSQASISAPLPAPLPPRQYTTQEPAPVRESVPEPVPATTQTPLASPKASPGEESYAIYFPHSSSAASLPRGEGEGEGEGEQERIEYPAKPLDSMFVSSIPEEQFYAKKPGEAEMLKPYDMSCWDHVTDTLSGIALKCASSKLCAAACNKLDATRLCKATSRQRRVCLSIGIVVGIVLVIGLAAGLSAQGGGQSDQEKQLQIANAQLSSSMSDLNPQLASAPTGKILKSPIPVTLNSSKLTLSNDDLEDLIVSLDPTGVVTLNVTKVEEPSLEWLDGFPRRRLLTTKDLVPNRVMLFNVSLSFLPGKVFNGTLVLFVSTLSFTPRTEIAVRVDIASSTFKLTELTAFPVSSWVNEFSTTQATVVFATSELYIDDDGTGQPLTIAKGVNFGGSSKVTLPSSGFLDEFTDFVSGTPTLSITGSAPLPNCTVNGTIACVQNMTAYSGASFDVTFSGVTIGAPSGDVTATLTDLALRVDGLGTNLNDVQVKLLSNVTVSVLGSSFNGIVKGSWDPDHSIKLQGSFDSLVIPNTEKFISFVDANVNLTFSRDQKLTKFEEVKGTATVALPFLGAGATADLVVLPDNYGVITTASVGAATLSDLVCDLFNACNVAIFDQLPNLSFSLRVAILSNRLYYDSVDLDSGITVWAEANFSPPPAVKDVAELLGLSNSTKALVGINFQPGVLSAFKVFMSYNNIIPTVNGQPQVSQTYTFVMAGVALEPLETNPSLEVSTAFLLDGIAPSPLYFTLSAKFSPGGVWLRGAMESTWENFLIQGLNLSDVALGVQVSPGPSITGLEIAANLTFGRAVLSGDIYMDVLSNKYYVDVYASNIKMGDVTRFIMKAISADGGKYSSVATAVQSVADQISLNKLQLKVVPQTAVINGQLYNQEFTFRGNLSFLGADIYLGMSYLKRNLVIPTLGLVIPTDIPDFEFEFATSGLEEPFKQALNLTAQVLDQLKTKLDESTMPSLSSCIYITSSQAWKDIGGCIANCAGCAVFGGCSTCCKSCTDKKTLPLSTWASSVVDKVASAESIMKGFSVNNISIAKFSILDVIISNDPVTLHVDINVPGSHIVFDKSIQLNLISSLTSLVDTIWTEAKKQVSNLINNIIKNIISDACSIIRSAVNSWKSGFSLIEDFVDIDLPFPDISC